MITISKKVEYSFIFINYLAKRPKLKVSLKEVAEKAQLPYRFLGQLANKLKIAGIIDSREGKSGGYSLKGGWQRKNLYELLEALDENRHLVKCLGKGGKCVRAERCGIRNIWGKMEQSLVRELKLIKLIEI